MNGVGVACSSPTCAVVAWVMTLPTDERIGAWLTKNGWTRDSDPTNYGGWLCERCSA